MKSFPWQLLLDWYKQNGRHDYPWRQYLDAGFKIQNSKLSLPPSNGEIVKSGIYMVWLAEILLQQTQADRVVPFYQKILSKYPTIEQLARADYDEFFPYYQGLGYYSRARNLLKTANIVSTEYSGIFPRDKPQLKKLPGIGEYTARAILAFGYGDTLLAWDTNLETIFSRYYKGAKNIKLSEEEKNGIERDFQDFVSEKSGEQGMGVRGGGTVGAMMRSETKKSEAKIERVWLPTDAFDTFGSKSIENGVGKNILVRNINNALMDWARTMEPKTANLLDQNNYIFKESEFYITNGANEIIEKKVSVSFPTPDAQVVVILHQDHRVYYTASVIPDLIRNPAGTDTTGSPYARGGQEQGTFSGYSPFILPASEDRDTRGYVQSYFREIYRLELSVRPVHHKWLSGDGKPYIAVHAQIQAGDPTRLAQYSKAEMKISIEQLYSL